MTLSILLLSATLAQFGGPADGNSNESQVQACIQTCYAYAERPSYELKACVEKCLELAKP